MISAGGDVIEVSGLRMAYDGFEAVRAIDLRVGRGEIFTFLGPNGAGKTTTVEILEGHRRRTAGEVRVLGEDPQPKPRSQRACARDSRTARLRAAARARRRPAHRALERALCRAARPGRGARPRG